ncbi:DMT family transporter [Microbulbifer variabilis]|uniref:EamA family transporter n=2 Tax=Microbulbifer TaxID=48073 RepID=A0ABY4VH29_9GAMM|nr:EamA family transporter [Microbulbifer variabilis]USD23397.1 EamA family transporter [Microbulbifer variabilis]
MPIHSILKALACVFIIGMAYPIVKLALSDVPPLMLTAMRYALASIPFVWFFPFPKTSVWNVVLIGVFLQLLTTGLVYLAMRTDAQAGIASLLVQSQVIFTLIFSICFFAEKISWQQLVGLLIAAAGFTLFFIDADKGGATTQKGFLLLMGSGMAWAIANLALKRMRGVNLFHLMVWASLVPPIPLFVLSYFLETRKPVQHLLEASPIAWGAILYQSLFLTLLAYVWWGDLIRRYSAAFVAPFGLLVPVFGLMGSWVILGESMDAMEWGASLLVFIGIAFCVINVQAIEAQARQ